MDDAELDRHDFSSFMVAVTGFEPFPWQRRLLGVVLDSGWPPLLDLPTGSGKTSALLVALFALALDPARSARRIALVVDRRIIVDQVDAFARRVQAALDDPSDPVCSRVAACLRALSSSRDGVPVRVVHLRGGIPRDDAWVGTPDQPTIIASTVDQVGSRLLFRGYGVSESMRPVHAGVLARDTLYFLDEVHLASAFEETLGRLEHTYEGWAERGGTGRCFQVVRMSATPRSTDDPALAFGLDDEDRAHPLLKVRLAARREATLEVVKTKRAKTGEDRAINHGRIAEAVCERARAAAKVGARAIGVVVNRVDTARRAAAQLRAEVDGEVLLLTGRMRPFDRVSIQAVLEKVAVAGAVREPEAATAYVVATSCIEAGADLDFDALVTELASLDALRQRFGRLNRLGRHDEVCAWILARSDQLSASAPVDPVYGAALRATWGYLSEVAQRGQVDFGLQAFPEPPRERRAELLPPAPEAPVMFPSYLDMWSETRPAPHPDPEPALWLHGKGARRDRDVNVIFRADVPVADDEGSEQIGLVSELLEFLPPLADEAVSVSVRELRDWHGAWARRAWTWTADGVEAVELDDLRPGATLIIPASRGGLGAGTWDPSSTDPVEDVAEAVAFAARKIAKLRLDASTLPSWLKVDEVPGPSSTDDPEAFDDAQRVCMTWLLGLNHRQGSAPATWQPLLAALADPAARRVIRAASSASGGRVWHVTAVPDRRAVEASTEDAVSSFSGVEVSLARHLEDVEAWAAAFARAAGLDADVAGDVALAALLHDMGKADLRFQAMLHGGDAVRAAGGQPLAKSRQFGSAKARQYARRRSGWPEGLRHELVSLALLDASPELRARASDLELVRHLVASHHGWCRPWAPSTVDPKPTRVKVDIKGLAVEVCTDAIDDELLNQCPARFRRLCRRYGWHGLAYLEALLRLGDHRASARPGARPEGER